MLARCLPGAPAPFCTSWRGSPWSAMPRLLATGFTFGYQVVEKLTGGRKPRRSAVMQQRQCADRVRGGIENQFGPLRPACVFQGDGVHAGTRHQPSQFLHIAHGSVGGFERANPGIALNVVADVSRFDGCPAGKVVPRTTYFTCSAMISSLPTPFCTEHTTLSSSKICATCAAGIPGVDCLGGDDAVVAAR